MRIFVKAAFVSNLVFWVMVSFAMRAGVAQEDFQKTRSECRAGNGKACFHLGQIYHQSPHDDKKLKQAAKFYRLSCERSYVPACSELRLWYRNGFVVKKDREKAQEIYLRIFEIRIKNCENGDAGQCEKLGRHYWSAHLLKKALKFYQLACENGRTKSCVALARRYERNSRIRDLPKAAALYEMACERGEKDICFKLGHMFHIRSPRGLQLNYTKAAEMYGKACELHHEEACQRKRRLAIALSSPASLEPLRKLKCLVPKDLKPQFTPPDLALALQDCLEQGRRQDAFFAFWMLYAFGYYDGLRLGEFTGLSGFYNIMGRVEDAMRRTAPEEFKRPGALSSILAAKTDAQREELCHFLTQMGSPDYKPDYLGSGLITSN